MCTSARRVQPLRGPDGQLGPPCGRVARGRSGSAGEHHRATGARQ